MKLSSAIVIVLTILYTGCKPHKNATVSTAPVVPAAPLTTDDLVKVAKTKWPDVTAQTIDEGQAIYTTGACIKCHVAAKIETISEQEWPPIIDRMARKAHISDTQKDAVMKYVLAMKIAGK